VKEHKSNNPLRKTIDRMEDAVTTHKFLEIGGVVLENIFEWIDK